MAKKTTQNERVLNDESGAFMISDKDFDTPRSHRKTKTKEQEMSEFEDKNDFISRQNILDLAEVDCLEFLDLVFDRNIGEHRNVEPMEEPRCDEYELWNEQDQLLHQGKIEKIDYSGYCCWKYNPIIFYIDGKKTRKNSKGETVEVKDCKHRVVLKNDSGLQPFLNAREFALLSPITYVGRNNSYENARYLYAFAFDLDGVTTNRHVEVLFGLMMTGEIPAANLITSSGHGLHLWYLLDKPVAMYKPNRELLNKMKHGLTNVLWNPITSDDKQKQYQGVIQGFRLPGTMTKFGEPIRSWQNLDAPLHTLEDLNAHLTAYKLTREEMQQLGSDKPTYNPASTTMEEAERRWPEWYVARVLQKKTVIKPWNVKRDVYDWWLEKLRNSKFGKDSDIRLHHRYWCVLTLVVYAVKCNIPREEVLADGYSLVPKMDAYSDSDTNRFTEGDVDDAMRAYDENYNTWPIREIEKTTLISIKRNKRNRRKREDHLKIMNFVRDNIALPDGNWRYKGGKGAVSSDLNTSAQKVAVWRLSHPEGKKIQCEAETGLTRHTVIKWWDASVNEDTLAVLNWRSQHPFSESIEECAYAEKLSKTTVRRWWGLLDTPLTSNKRPKARRKTTEKRTVLLAKLFAPGSDYTIEGYTHEEVVSIVSSGQWQELGWELGY